MAISTFEALPEHFLTGSFLTSLSNVSEEAREP
jgi:hypothetical protein